MYWDSSEKWLNLGMGLEIYKMNLELLIVLESKEMSRKPIGLVNAHGHSYQPDGAPSGQSNKIKA